MSQSGNQASGGEPTGRRARNRIARHDQLMAAASEIVSTEGLDGLTMQAVAERVDCAVGTIYTYFDSKSSLLTALQIAAIETLGASFGRSRAAWDEDLALSELDDSTKALVRLLAFGHLFTSAPALHPREFELLQVLLSSRRRETSDEDAQRVLPYALGLINEFRVLIEAAVDVGALESDRDPDADNDYSLSRTIRWAGALNGALLVSNAGAVPTDPIETDGDGPTQVAVGGVFDGRVLALRLARDLLAGWGAARADLEAADDFVEELLARDRLAVTSADDVVGPTDDGTNGDGTNGDGERDEGAAGDAAPDPA